MQILILIILGAGVGFLATRLLRVELDLITTILIGAVGAGIGWLALRFLFVMSGGLALVLGAIVGALVVTWIWTRLMR
jgi:uncharacterized membrane protein YeaQ/YmgE (transglycosylase-associated protein family)